MSLARWAEATGEALFPCPCEGSDRPAYTVEITRDGLPLALWGLDDYHVTAVVAGFIWLVPVG